MDGPSPNSDGGPSAVTIAVTTVQLKLALYPRTYYRLILARNSETISDLEEKPSAL